MILVVLEVLSAAQTFILTLTWVYRWLVDE